MDVTKTKTLENEDLRPKTRLSFRDYEITRRSASAHNLQTYIINIVALRRG